jgi:hypothetical protein
VSEPLSEKLRRERLEAAQRYERARREREAHEEYVVAWMLAEIEDFLAEAAGEDL